MISIEKRGKIDVISFKVTKINALIIEELREGILKILEISNSRVILDLKGVEYVDSSGFGFFLSLMKSARNNYCALKFANPEPRVTELFEMLNLHTVLEIFDDMDTCIRSFR